MRMLTSALCLVSLLVPATALAQAFPPNEAGVTMGHWHLNSVSVEANQKLLTAMGGTALKPGDFNLVRFPGVFVFLHLRQTGTPPTGGTEGSIVNHVGLTVPNVQEAAERVKVNGGQILNGPMEVPGGDWIVNCMDPQGGAFSVHHKKAE